MIKNRKIIIILIALIAVGAVFFGRGKIRDVYDSLRRPVLPAAVKFQVLEGRLQEERQKELSKFTRHPEQEASEAIGVVKDPVDSEVLVDDFWDSSGILQNDAVVAPSLPNEYNLAVPFQPQAPKANWGLPYQEACEEASLIMADAFFNGRGLTADSMDISINKLVDWQKKRFGYYEDTTAEEAAIIAKEYFYLNAAVDYDVTVENIKGYIAQNKLVLAPAAGRVLPNPYFSGQGPLYHMLVIRGYTDKYFITNDPGTRRGEEFLYEYDDLINAIHNWSHDFKKYPSDIIAEKILDGEKAMIVVDIAPE